MDVILKSINFLIVLSSWLRTAHMQGGNNIRLEKVEFCPGSSNEVIFFIRPKNFNRGQQLIDFNLSIPYPLGDAFLVNIQLEKESPIVKGSWLYLVSFNVKEGVCAAMEKYMGELAYDMETAVGVARKACPLPKGVYHATNHVLDFSKLRLPLMPSGKTRVKVELRHKQKMQLVLCEIYVLSSL